MDEDSLKNDPFDRDVEQAITGLKKGAHLLKDRRRGKPKFCPFRLSNDETELIWYSGKVEKQLRINQVSRIIPGQRTRIFQRHPRLDKEFQSFSLIYGQRSLDLICKDKDETEAWFVGLNALISQWNYKRSTTEVNDYKVPDSLTKHILGESPLASSFYSCDAKNKDLPNVDAREFIGSGNIFCDTVLCTGPDTSRVSALYIVLLIPSHLVVLRRPVGEHLDLITMSELAIEVQLVHPAMDLVMISIHWVMFSFGAKV